MKLIYAALLIICHATLIKADCYRFSGCVDTATSINFEAGSKWTPTSDPCYTCKCYAWKKPVLECVKVAEISPIKKSSSQFVANFDITFATPEEIEVIDEATNITCETLPLPTYDELIGFTESVTYKNVYYYVSLKESVCCSSSLMYYGIDSSCTEISTDDCQSKIVKKSNHDELCDKPYGVFR